jgi:hypothetical protein
MFKFLICDGLLVSFVVVVVVVVVVECHYCHPLIVISCSLGKLWLICTLFNLTPLLYFCNRRYDHSQVMENVWETNLALGLHPTAT